VTLPDVVSRDEWTEARLRLLAAEKELTRRHDVVNADRRRLPMVRVEKDYSFEGPKGPATLADLFDGHRQLVVQHVMFAPGWEAACPGCTATVDELSEGVLRHMSSRDTGFALVARAALGQLEAYRMERGWTAPWYSSYGSDFNYDFEATLPDAQESFVEMAGLSSFLRDGNDIFHTYSTFARGTEYVGNAYTLLDLTAFGRSEDWEEPKGRAPRLHGADPTFTD
jgi:predicted dithiol-disulfide oxidoreductase (DUF899 family)